MNATQNIEAEAALLGACLIDPERIAEAGMILSAEDFFLPSHGKLFQTLAKMRDAGEPIDSIIVADRFKEFPASEIIHLQENGLASFASHYAKIVREKSILRLLSNTTTELQQKIADGINSAEVIAGLNQLITKLLHTQRNSYFTAQELSEQFINQIELAQEGERHNEVKTGLTPIDDAVSGMMNGDLIIVAGRPGMGKTALAMNVGSNIAMRGESVIVVSIESPALKIFARLVSSTSRIENRKLQTLRLTDFESDQAVAAARTIGQAPIYFLERERRWDKITNIIRAIKLKDHNVSLVVIDYVQLVRTSYRVERYQELGLICGDCKALAQELNVPFLVLSQLNRKVEDRQDKRPNLSDLKESGALEQDADLVGLIFRERYYDKTADNTVELDIAKAREGRSGIIKLHYDEEHVRFF